MGRKYEKLRRKISSAGMSVKYLAEELMGCSASHLYNRLSGKTPWEIHEMYTILDILYIPHKKLHRYFPPNGEAGKEKEPSSKTAQRGKTA